MGADLRAVLRRNAPELADVALRPVGHGTGHEAVLAGNLVLRRATGATDPSREARLLVALGPRLFLPVPAPRFTDGDVLAYPLLPGRPLLGGTPPPGTARVLGGFLRVLHGLDPAELPMPEEPAEPAEWLTGLEVPADLLAELRADVPPPGTRMVPAHADLGAEHLLTDGARITGVLDWSDAAVTDPALDLARPYRDFGRAFLADLLGAYGPIDAATRRRVEFFARATALEDLVYGAEPGRAAYADAARAAIARLFPGYVPDMRGGTGP